MLEWSNGKESVISCGAELTILMDVNYHMANILLTCAFYILHSTVTRFYKKSAISIYVHIFFVSPITRTL